MLLSARAGEGGPSPAPLLGGPAAPQRTKGARPARFPARHPPAVFCPLPAVRCPQSAVRDLAVFGSPSAGFPRCFLSAVRGSLSAVRRPLSAVPRFRLRMGCVSRKHGGKRAGSARQPLCVPNRRCCSERRDQYVLGLRWLAVGCSLAPFGMPSRPRPSAGFRGREELAASPPSASRLPPLFSVRCALFAVPLFSVRCALFAVPLFSVRCSPFAVRGPLCAVCCLAVFRTPPAGFPRCFLSAVRGPLCAVRCFLSAVRCSRCAVRGPLSAVRCPQFAVRGPLSHRVPYPARRPPNAVFCPRCAVRCPRFAVPLSAVPPCSVPRPPAPPPRCFLSAVRCPAVRCPAVFCVLSRRPLCAVFRPLFPARCLLERRAES